MTRPRPLLLALCAAGLLGSGVAPARAADAPATGAPGTDVLERVAPAIVAVDAVFQARVTYQGQTVVDQEVPAPGLGAVVDPSGLVVMGDVGHLTRAFEQGMEGLRVSISPRSLKVTFGGDPKEHEAVLVVRDSTVGVAFLQVLDLADRRVPAVDFAKGGAEPRLGQDLIGVRRMGRGFDHAPEALRLSVAQAIVQPRRMWGIRGDFHEHGLPAFDAAGAPVGLVTLQFGSDGVDAASLLNARRMPAHLCLLPLDTLRPLVEQARKRVPAALEKARGAKEATPPAEGTGTDGAPGGAAPGDKPPEKDPAPPR